MRIIPFLILIGVIALIGLALLFFGGDLMIISTLPFGLDFALIAIKVGNWWRRVRETL